MSVLFFIQKELDKMTRQEIIFGLDKLIDKIDKKGGLLNNKKHGADEITALKAVRSIIEEVPDKYIDNYK